MHKDIFKDLTWYVMHKTSQFLFSGFFYCFVKCVLEISSVFVMAPIPIFIISFVSPLVGWSQCDTKPDFSMERGTNHVAFIFY